jgi:hypothetical protein
MKTLIYRAMIAVLFGFSSSVALATTFEIVYEQDEPNTGYFDLTPVDPIDGNPATTRGGQMQYVFEHGVKLFSRVFWVPDTVVLPITTGVIPRSINPNFYGSGGPSYPFAGGGYTGDYNGLDLRVNPEDYGILPNVDYGEPALAVLTGGDSWLHKPDGENRFGSIYLGDQPHVDTSINFVEGQFISYLPIIIHEALHMMGMVSHVGNINGGSAVDVTPYDLLVRHLGADPDTIADMTIEQQVAMYRAGDDVVFIGDQARAHAQALMPQGYDSDNNIILYAEDEGAEDSDFLSQPVSHIDMHYLPDVEESLMSPVGASTLELGIVAYMFSDMGYGPVVDTSVSSSSANVNSLSIETQALVSDLVAIPDDQVEQIAVTMVLPEGLSFDAFTAEPATCVLDEDNTQKAVCTYDQLLINTPSMMEVALLGDDGVYTVELDVEHQAMHVDGVPANNFFSASVVMGVNPLSDFVLSSSLVESDVAEGAVIGTFSVSNSSDEAVAYTLLDGEGVLSLLGADVVASDALTSADNGSYSLTVQARTPTGYALESVFDVVVSINPITNVALTSSTITQNTSAGSVVGTLSADHALDGEVSFSLVDGVSDNAGFEIDGDEVKTSESLARSDNGTYSLVVVASDGEYSVESTIAVVVNIPALVTPEPPSSGGGGGCTVGAPGQSDGSLPLLMLGLALMWVRRRII